MKHALFLLLLIAFVGCDNADSLSSPSMSTIYYYAESPLPELPFDEKTGILKPGIMRQEIGAVPFKLGVLNDGKKSEIISSWPQDINSTFVVDGNYALWLSAQHTHNSFYIADAFVHFSGLYRMSSLAVGFNMWRGFIDKQKINLPQKASVEIAKSVITGSLAINPESFLTLKPGAGLFVTNDWVNSSAAIGLIIDAARVKNKQNQSDLWRLWSPSVDINHGVVRAPNIVIKNLSTIQLTGARLHTDKLEAQKSIIHIESNSQLEGALIMNNDSFLLCEQNIEFTKNTQGEYQKNAQGKYVPKAINLASLTIDGTADISGTIATRNTSIPGDVDELRFYYQDLLAKQKEFILVKAKKLTGHARLLSQSRAQVELGHYGDDVSYFEKFVAEAGKKLALQHDYTTGTISLKLVDKSQALDAAGCLPDIGVPF